MDHFQAVCTVIVCLLVAAALIAICQPSDAAKAAAKATAEENIQLKLSVSELRHANEELLGDFSVAENLKLENSELREQLEENVRQSKYWAVAYQELLLLVTSEGYNVSKVPARSAHLELEKKRKVSPVQ